jgi:regulation of enolase protein 1 (concanavalin A-like superfamily)
MNEDGKKWAEDTTAEVKLPKKLKVGVAAVNSTTSPFAPQFEDFKLTKK